MCFDQRASKRSDLMACEPGELVELNTLPDYLDLNRDALRTPFGNNLVTKF